MRAPAEGFVDANGIRLHYLDWGEGGSPVLLLLHGGSAHAHWWDLFAAAVADRYRVVALDLRGHGDSGHSELRAYAIEDYVADVAAVVAQLRLPRLALVGHSMGALVAASYAAHASIPIDALVIVDIRIRPAHDGHRFIERLRHWPHPTYASRAEGIRRFRLLPSATAAAPELLAHLAAHGLRDLPDGRATPKFDRAALSDAAASDVAGDLSRLRCPILYVRGQKSGLVSHAAIEDARSVAPQVQAVEIPQAHHHVMLDNPEGFESALRDFLDRLPERV